MQEELETYTDHQMANIEAELYVETKILHINEGMIWANFLVIHWNGKAL